MLKDETKNFLIKSMKWNIVAMVTYDIDDGIK